MKKNLHLLILEITQNALITLYLMISTQKRFVTKQKRNECLSRYLKSKQKEPHYKPIKKEIKLMILLERKSGDLEDKLLELNKHAFAEMSNVDDAKTLYDFLQSVHENHGYDSKLYESTKDHDHDVIYILQEQLVNCFSHNGKQLAPVSIIISLKKINKESFINNLAAKDQFQLEIKEYNVETQALHVLLHPKEIDLNKYNIESNNETT